MRFSSFVIFITHYALLVFSIWLFFALLLFSFYRVSVFNDGYKTENEKNNFALLSPSFVISLRLHRLYLAIPSRPSYARARAR